jgi:putative transcriptional regulator
MDLSQSQFATKFGFPPATLRNREQHRSRPDAPTRVLRAVIAKHPEAVEDLLAKAGKGSRPRPATTNAKGLGLADSD